MPWTTQQFANSIRAKYPTGMASDGTYYANMPDQDLVDRVIAKYPVYKSQISDYQAVQPNQPAQQTGGILNTVKNVGKSLLSSEMGFGSDIAQAYEAGIHTPIGDIGGGGAKNIDLINQSYLKTGDVWMKLAIAHRNDPIKAQKYMNNAKESFAQAGQTWDNVLPFYKKSAEQVLGEAGGTLIDALSGGIGGAAAGEAKPVVGIGKGILQGAKLGAIAGGTYGAIKGATGGMQQGENLGGVAASGVKGGALGAAGGGIMGGITGGISGGLAQRAANQETGNYDIAIKSMTPSKLSQTELEAAREQGLIGENDSLLPSPEKQRVAQAINDSGISLKGMKTQEQINTLVDTANGTSETVTKPYIAENNKIFTDEGKTALTSQIEAYQVPKGIAPENEAAIQRVKDLAKDEIIGAGDTSGKLEGRINFDTKVDKYFKDIYEYGKAPTPVEQATLAIRKMMNNSIASDLPDPNIYNNALAYEHNLYRGAEIINQSQGATKTLWKKIPWWVKASGGITLTSAGLGGIVKVGKGLMGGPTGE